MKSAKNIFHPTTDPLSVGLLVIDESNTLSVAAAVDPMRAANRRANKTIFEWTFFSTSNAKPRLTSGINIDGEQLIRFAGDLMFIIAGFDLEKHATPSTLAKIREIAGTGVVLCGVDGGSWLLAAAGVLDGQTATCHWEDLQKFALKFPRVNLVPDRYAISGQFLTTGGASPCIDLMLHLIAVRYGVGLSEKVASAFIYDPVYPGSAPQNRVATQKIAKANPRIARIIQQMSDTIDMPLAIAEIAKQNGISTRKLEMEFKQATGRSPGAYYLDLRLGEAQMMALDSHQSVLEIAIATGFTSQASFARAFKTAFKMSLTEFRNLPRS